MGGFPEFGEHAGRAVGAPGTDPGGEGAVGGEPGGEGPDVLVARGRPGPELLPLLVGGVFVVHGRVRRDQEDTVLGGGGPLRRDRCQEGGGGADGHGGARQQGGGAEYLPGPGVRVGVGDDDPVDQFGAGGEHGRVVGGVDGLGEVTPARQGRDPVFAEVFDGGEDVRAGRQQSAVAEGAEDTGVVGGGGPQVEEQALVEQLAQFVGALVELLGGERLRALRSGGCLRAARRPAGVRYSTGGRHAQQIGEAGFGRDGFGGPALGLVGLLGGAGAVGGPGRGEFGAALGRRRLPGVVGRGPGGVPGGVPGRDRGLLRVVRGEGGAGRVGVGRHVVEPARPDRFGGLLFDLGQALAEVAGLAPGALGLGGRCGGVTVRRLPGGLEDRGALLLLVGDAFARLGRGVQGAYEVGGGRGAGGEGGGGVAAAPLRRPARRRAGSGRRPVRGAGPPRPSPPRRGRGRRVGRRVRRRPGRGGRGWPRPR